MKKVVYLLIAVSLMLALVPTMALAHTEDEPHKVTLLAGQTDPIGEVHVWNDADTLYVKFVYTGPDCGFLEVHLQVDEGTFSEDILTKKGNPIPGQFEKSYKPGGCFAENTFTYDLAAENFDCDDPLVIAAHAALGREEAMTFESNVGDTVYGPISSNDMPTDWGTAGSAVRAYNWLGYTRDLSNPDQIPACTTNPLSSLSWNWGFGLNPTYSPDIPGVLWISTAPNTEQWGVDSWRKFVESYEVPGYPIASSLQVNADNYYVVSNGETIGSDDDIFNGPETYAFYPMEGPNTLEFVTENWAQGSPTDYCDQLRNPNGVTYKGTVSYYADGETAWGCGTDNCIDFDGKNWATYFEYTVQCCTNVPNVVNGGFEEPVPATSQGWDIYDSGTEGLGWTVEWYDGSTSYGGQTRPATAHLELHKSGTVVSSYEGNQYAELDTDWDGPGGGLNGEPASVRIYQDLDTCPGASYTLHFAWAPRPGYTSQLEVYWDGDPLGPFEGGSGWQQEEFPVSASGTSTQLEFVETGPSDSFGMFLDDVRVEIPTP
jgi:hypothetical protein